MSITGSKLVLVVEDDDAVRHSTITLLKALGYDARGFASSELFLADPGWTEADCLVLDHHLAGMSGIELLEDLRARGVRTPAILVTGNGGRAATRAQKAGAAVMLRKPLSADLLSIWLERIFAAPA